MARKIANKEKVLQVQALGLLIGYALQFVAGIVLNLFVQVTDTHPGANASEYFGGALRGLGWALSDGGGWILAFHAYLAVGLVLGSLSILYQSTRLGRKSWTIAATLAALFTIGALFNGLSFINYNHDVSSLVMALCWLTAVGAMVFIVADRRSSIKG